MTLTVEQIDRELTARTAEVAGFAEALLELDIHPGLQHLRRYPPTGATAQRWSALEPVLAALWEDLATMTATLQSAQEMRDRRPIPNESERAAVTRLLTDQPGIADAACRLRTDCPRVTEFLDAVDGIDSLIASGLSPALKQFDTAGTPVPPEVVVLLQISARDPLSLSPQELADRVGAIGELALITADWPAALAATHTLLDELRSATQQAAATRAAAAQTVLTTLPAMAAVDSVLRQLLQSLVAPDPGALSSVRRQAQAALANVRAQQELAQGLLDRHRELNGRLGGYQAKARRLGLADDPALAASARTAAGLLRGQPSDLARATLAITDYRRLLAQKQETTA